MSAESPSAAAESPESRGETPEYDTEWCRLITCPHCGKEHRETTEYPSSLRYDGDATETECWYCGKEFRVVLSVTYEYTTSKDANERR